MIYEGETEVGLGLAPEGSQVGWIPACAGMIKGKRE
jgi:hypothetical protein